MSRIIAPAHIWGQSVVLELDPNLTIPEDVEKAVLTSAQDKRLTQLPGALRRLIFALLNEDSKSRLVSQCIVGTAPNGKLLLEMTITSAYERQSTIDTVLQRVKEPLGFLKVEKRDHGSSKRPSNTSLEVPKAPLPGCGRKIGAFLGFIHPPEDPPGPKHGRHR